MPGGNRSSERTVLILQENGAEGAEHSSTLGAALRSANTRPENALPQKRGKHPARGASVALELPSAQL